jgi:hypothetical protein
MIAATVAITLALSWTDPTPAGAALEGSAAFYDAGLMARVLVNRGAIPDVEEYPAWLSRRGLLGTVALNRMADLYRHVWIDGPAGIEGPFLVTDCAQREHYISPERQGRIVEVDHQTARRWGMRDLIPVTVYFRNPLPLPDNLPEPY